MGAALRWAIWPQVVAMSVIGLAAASCTDTERFTSLMGPGQAARSDTGGGVPQGAPGAVPQGAPAPAAPSDRVDGRPMPPIGGGAGGGSEITGAVPAPAPTPASWTRVGGRPIVVARGETLDALARKYAVPAYAIMQANALSSPGVHAGQHLVIPRQSSSTAAAAPRTEPARTHLAAAAGPAPGQAARPPGARADSTVHVVAPGETLNSVARRYGKPVMVLARANNIPPDTMVRVGQHIVIPDARRSAQATGPSAAAAHKAAQHKVARQEALKQEADKQQANKQQDAKHEANKQAAAKHEASKHEASRQKASKHQDAKHQDAGRGDAKHQVAAGAAASGKPAKRADVARRQVASADDDGAFKASAVAAPQAAAKPAQPAGASPSFRWPVRGHVITGFGPKPNGLQNDGIDLAVPQGTPVKAADDGVVAYAGNELKGYGNLVLIRHSNGYVTAYAHASEILVKRGEPVKRGQVIAKSGETGTVKSPELHFEIRKGATPVDPAQFLKGA